VGFGTGALLSSSEPASPALGPQADARPAPAPLAARPPRVPEQALQTDAGTPATPPVAVDAAPTAPRDAAPAAADTERARKEQRQRIDRAMAQGRLDDARRELEDFVMRYPEDKTGPQLLESVKVLQSKLGAGQPGPDKR